MCVLCVQELAGCQRQLQDPSLSVKERAELEKLVLGANNDIQRYKGKIASCEEAIQAKQLALSTGQGKG